MDWPRIRQLITEGESSHTEVKRGLEDMVPVCRAICALANTEGGSLVLAIDGAEEIVGVKEDAESVQERLKSFPQTGCIPALTIRQRGIKLVNPSVPAGSSSS